MQAGDSAAGVLGAPIEDRADRGSRLGLIEAAGEGRIAKRSLDARVDHRLHEGARGARSGMRHQVHLDEAWRRIAPVREGPHRHGAAHGGAEARAPAPSLGRRDPAFRRQSVDRCRAHGTKRRAQPLVDLDLPMLFQCRQ